MSETSRFFRKHPLGKFTDLHATAKSIVKDLPILRMPRNANPHDDEDATAEEIGEDERIKIPPHEIIELAHLSKDTDIPRFYCSGICNWADAIAAELPLARNITAEIAHDPFWALYLIRVHAPNWPKPDERVTPIVARPSNAGAVWECSLAFKVAEG
ncbi:hypothetical protein [Stenotrophomonas sp. WZN-1]|uniref:hypothetical protein n=1 Tax=Stenotrophomonas sp. WZN-1 TaxID=2005046 RepID=UPI0012FDB720|nr:hypothetical protein [Stenotrophomonas sp. WZN-1]